MGKGLMDVPAWAWARPYIVATDVGETRAVLEDGRWGQLVPPNDPVALVAAIRTALEWRAAFRLAQGGMRCRQ